MLRHVWFDIVVFISTLKIVYNITIALLCVRTTQVFTNMAELSYIHTPVRYSYHFMTIPEKLEIQASRLEDKEVYVFLDLHGNRSGITARELYNRSKCLAKAFIKLGIKRGDVIAVCQNNTRSGLISLFGVILSGAIVVNVISSKSDGSDLNDLLSKVNAKALIIDRGVSNSVLKACTHFIDEFDGNGNARSAAVPSLKYFVTSTFDDNFSTLTLDQLLTFETNGIVLPKLDADDTMTLFPTSGSTGDSKFVPQSHFAAMIIGNQLHESIGYDTDDVIYTERRFAWIGGFPFMLLHDGVKVVTKTSPIPNMEKHCKFTLNALVNERCTHACLLPVTVIGLNDLVSKASIPSLKLKGIHTGGLPVATACAAGVGIYIERLTNCYGSSEAGFITSCHVTTKDEFTDYNTGQPLQGVEIKIVDFNGNIMTRGQIGNVHLRSPSLLRGYFKNEAKTAEVLTTSRWFNTDDTGFINEHGDLIVTGRQSDIILQGGKNHVPSEIESIIKSHPKVLDVIVVPVPDEAMFQLACACIIAKPEEELSVGEVKDFYKSLYASTEREAFGGFLPRMFLMFNEYPRLYTGKPDKKQLIQEAIKRKSEAA